MQKNVEITVATHPEGWMVTLGAPKDRAMLQFIATTPEAILRVIAQEVFQVSPSQLRERFNEQQAKRPE